MIKDQWCGCYAGSWKGLIVDEAFCHPAKYSRILIRRIYNHLFECGLLQSGQSVLDPFGGIALGGLEAMLNGCHWQGVELEAKFCGYAIQNIELWKQRFAGLQNLGTARIHCGDSRRLLDVIGTLKDDFDAVISSPPYDDTNQNYAKGYKYVKIDGARLDHNDKQRLSSYGDTEGGIANSCSFWLAALDIVAQTFEALAPGGVACWVTKAYIKDSAVVDFPGRWRQLCESVGFVTIHEHHALQVEHKAEQGGLFGESKQIKTQQISFFKNLYHKKRPDLAIEHETVFCMVKPK